MSTQNANVARFARNVEWDFLYDFQTQWHIAYCFATANRTTKMMVVVDTTWYPDTVSFFEAWFMIQASPSSLALLCVFCTWASSEIYQSRYIPSDNSFYKKNVDCNYNNVLTTFLTNELFFVLRLYSRLYYNVPWKKKEVFAFCFFSDVVKFFPFLPLFRRKFLLLPSQS